MADRISTYVKQLDAAEKEVKAALPGKVDVTAFLTGMRKKVNTVLSARLEEFMSELGSGNELEAYDCMDCAWGRAPAEKFAQESGITDETALEKVREFGFHQAALWIQTNLGVERDMKEAEAGIDSVGGHDDFGDGDW